MIPDLTGKTLKHYRILALLGHGGMGEVWVAEDTLLGRKVALKTLPSGVAADLDRRARFEREARAIAALNHPNVVTIHSVEHAGDVVFLTMELIDGKTLAEVIPAHGLPLDRFFELAVPLAAAFAAAHQKGITHRDLKPANVMVTADGRVKVLDFGLAKLAEPAPAGTAGESTATTTTVTGEGTILGTVAYMSPEQAQGKPVDARSDVFSLGVVLYQMATGVLPFSGDTPISTITSILRDTPASIGELKPGVPRHLERVVQRCLAKQPDRRYQAALEVRNELEGLLAERAEKAAPRRLVLAVVAGLAVVGLVAAGAALWPKLRGAAPLVAPAAHVEHKSIAVLPFVNMSDDAKNDYFSDGLAEELLNVLAKVPGLKVAARTSSFHFKGATGNVPEIGRQLGVATLLEGSVRRAGNRVRITAELINVADGFQLWSESYDRELNDIFAIQESIAGEVVAALKVKLLGASTLATVPARKSTTNLAAYDAYLLGQQQLRRRTSGSIAEAATAFQKAIDIDPEYALAYVGLSDAVQRLTEYSALPEGEMLAKAEPLVQKALALDDRLGEAYASRGELQRARGDSAAATSDFEKAIALAPNYSMAYTWYSIVLRDSDPERALAMVQRALELDPLSPVVHCNVGHSLRQMGRPQEAAASFRRAIGLEPGLGAAYGVLSDMYFDELNEPEEAVRFQRKGIAADPGSPRQRVWLARTLGWLGRWDEALAEIRAVLGARPGYTLAHFELGRILAEQGRLDEALTAVKKAVDLDPGDPDGQSLLFFRLLDVADQGAAQEVVNRIRSEEGDGVRPHRLAYYLHLARGELGDADAEAHWLVDHAPESGRSEAWECDMRAGRFAVARDRLRAANPELFREREPQIRRENLDPALRVAAAEKKLGNNERAAMLLARCEAYVTSRDPGARRAIYRMALVSIRALQGRPDESLAALRVAVDAGQRTGWWRLAADPTLESIRDEPRFAAMVREMRPGG